MSFELQSQHEDMEPQDIIMHLREPYGQEARIERYRIAYALFACSMKEGTSVAQHAQKMYDYIERLQKLGYVMDNELYIDLILHSLSSTFSHFVINFNMHKMEVTLPELCNMLKTAQANLPETPRTTMVVAASKHKGKRKGKGNKGALKPTKGIQKMKGPTKAKEPKGVCFQCGKEGQGMDIRVGCTANA